MAINLAYRMTVYAGLYSSTDTTILTPAAGASHSDSFRIATKTGISGFLPYMEIPRGKRGSLSVPTQKLDVGTYTVDILDKRVSTSNANRWVSAFFGNVSGKMEIVGKKAFIEESTDGGSTWLPFFVGQIVDVSLGNALKVSITIKDNVNYLKEKLFTEYPRVDYGIYKTLVPATLSKTVTNEQGNGVFFRSTGINFDSLGKFPGIVDRAELIVSKAGLNDLRNIWPLELTNGRTQAYFGLGGRTTDMRALIRIGGTEYIFGVEFVTFPVNSNSTATPPKIIAVTIFPIIADDGGVGTFNDLPSGTISDGEFWLFTYNDKENGVFLVNNWDTILKDTLEGKFYQPMKVNGTFIPTSILQYRSVAYDSGSIAAIMSSSNIPRPAFYVDKSVSAVEWMEKNLLMPYSVGYTMEPAVISSVPQCVLRFFNTTAPVSASNLLTLGETDVVTSTPSWNAARPVNRIEVTHYTEVETRTTQDISEGSQQLIHGTRTIENKTTILNELSVDDGSETFEVDMNGLRAFSNIITPLSQSTWNQTDVDYRQRRVYDLARNILNRFKAGSPNIVVTTLRNANTNSMRVGDFINVELSVLPNQATHARGGTRIMQILSKYASGMNYEMELLDSGINQRMAAPTIGSLSSPAIGTVSASVTTTENAVVNVQYAAVDLSGSQPPENSNAWVMASLSTINNITKTIAFDNVPEGRTIYVRARTESPYNEDLKLPSRWVSGGSINLTNITTPSSVSVSNITARSAVITWTNTNTRFPIDVYMASPAGVLTQRVATLPAGSTVYLASGLHLNTSTSHRVGIRYTDPYLGFGSFATADFTATGSVPKLDAPAAIKLYVAR